MSWFERLRNTFRPGRVRDDIERELSFHIAERADQHRAEGVSDDEATRRARLQFGNVTLQAERTRDVDISLRIDAFLRNVRYAARTLAHTPGFTAAVVLTLGLGIGAKLPGIPAEYEETFELLAARADAERHMIAEARSVSPDYFATMQIPLMDGDGCRHQVPRTARDVVVNQVFATRYLSGRSSPVGLHLRRGEDKSSAHRIVGIVGSARERGLDRAPGPIVYWCADWNPMPYFLMRTSGDPAALAQTVRTKMKELEPARAVYDIAPLEERIGETFTQNRLRTVLLVLFGMAALSLACVGLYGTLNYVVSRRRREIGLRLALGAKRSDVIGQFLAQGLRVTGLAAACGVILSLGFTRVLSGMLYGVSPADPATLASVVGIVLGVATLAALIPATRAALVEPMRVLRDE